MELAGYCEGRVVSFAKKYIGISFTGYKVGDKIVGAEMEGHTVQYKGTLSSDRLEIAGRWWIEPDPTRGTLRNEGLFMLRREADA